MNTRNAPLSPVSVGGSDWPSYQKYQNPNIGDPYGSNNRGIISPPDSGGAIGNMNGFPPGPKSTGGPSPPPSVGRTSTGTTASGNMYARRDSNRSMRDESNEGVLGVHYVALKRYLQSTSKDGRANPPPNRARDKLLRLSAVQFLELSTDVYDELLRRQARERTGPAAPLPDYLQPENTFHPKRNQARQKLSTLGPPRFRDLATDVFCELERRFPGFAVGDIPSAPRGPSRAGTPSGGMNAMPPRGPSRMRRPSDASSVRSGYGPPRVNGDLAVPPSPRLPEGLERPQQKQFQSNTIVPNKSTMVEEDDDGVGDDDDADAFGLERDMTNRESKRSADSAAVSETDKRLLDESQAQVRDLQAKLDGLEDQLKQKDDELARVLDEERSRSTSDDTEKQQWAEARMDLENQLAEARELSRSLRSELDRMREDHEMEVNRLRAQIDESQQQGRSNGMGGDAALQQENQDLRMALQEQEQVTEEVRREARQHLQEMRILTEQHSPSWDKHVEMEKSIEQLEGEVREWRNRYARTKTQLRNMRSSSGLVTDQDATKYVREKGFAQDNGLVKDLHVTKFQIAIDELLRIARNDDPERVIDAMKSVVMSVRRISKDIDASGSNDSDMMQQYQKTKSRVSATANNLITASKNFAAAAGISPVSLLDAASSHLVAAVVELLRTVKIRATPAGELEEEDDGTITPVESTGFFSNRSTQDAFPSNPPDDMPPIQPLGLPAKIQGLGRNRDSAQSSAYSPVSSPRESVEPYNQNGGMNNIAGMMSNGYGSLQPDPRAVDLRIYLEDQQAMLQGSVQTLVEVIRNDAPIDEINAQINAIADVAMRVEGDGQASVMGDSALERLSTTRQRLMEAGEHGQDLAARGVGAGDREWRMWTSTVPPIAFELNRELKGLVERADRMAMPGGGADDFS